MISAHCRAGSLNSARGLLKQMTGEQLAPDTDPWLPGRGIVCHYVSLLLVFVPHIGTRRITGSYKWFVCPLIGFIFLVTLLVNPTHNTHEPASICMYVCTYVCMHVCGNMDR